MNAEDHYLQKERLSGEIENIYQKYKIEIKNIKLENR